MRILAQLLPEVIDAERRGLLKSFKDLASEHYSVMKVLTGSKHCGSQHGTANNTFFRDFEVYWVGKSLL